MHLKYIYNVNYSTAEMSSDNIKIFNKFILVVFNVKMLFQDVNFSNNFSEGI